jgi:hypothetical protein
MNDKWLGGPPSVIIPRLQSLLGIFRALPLRAASMGQLTP